MINWILKRNLGQDYLSDKGFTTDPSEALMFNSYALVQDYIKCAGVISGLSPIIFQQPDQPNNSIKYDFITYYVIMLKGCSVMYCCGLDFYSRKFERAMKFVNKTTCEEYMKKLEDSDCKMIECVVQLKSSERESYSEY